MKQNCTKRTLTVGYALGLLFLADPFMVSTQVPTRPKATPDSRVRRNLTGRWKFVMGKHAWAVRLTPRPGLTGEYKGMAQREEKDEQGKVVTMALGAALTKGTLKVWLGPGFIVCKGAFNGASPTEGECVEMDGDPAGSFRAEPITPSK